MIFLAPEGRLPRWSQGRFLALPAHAETISIGTTAQGSLGAAMGAALARVLESDDFNVRAVPLGGPEVSLPLLDRGEIEFAIVSADAASLAAAGQSIFEGRQTEHTELVAHLLPFSVGWFVRDDSEYKTLADLKGARVPWEFAQQRILGLWGEAQLEAAGVSPDDVMQVMATSAPNSIQDFMAGRVDAALFTVGSGLVSQADASVGGIRFLSLPQDGNAQTITSARVPGTTVVTLAPAGNLSGIVEPTTIMQSTLILLTRSDVSADVVKKVVSKIYESKSGLQEILPAFARFDPTEMSEPVDNLSYHPAAEAFYASTASKAEQ